MTFSYSSGHPGMWKQFRPNRTVVLGGLAVFLAILTLIDQVNTSANRVPGGRSGVPHGESASREIADNVAKSAPGEGLWGQVLTLRYLLENADLIRKRYQSVAVPYAEAVAPLAALYSAGEQPKAAVTKAVQSLIDPAIQVKAMLVSEGAAGQHGVKLFNVSLSLESRDSQAMLRTLLALGDAASGSVWKELSVGVDNNQRAVRLGGTLTVLAVQQAE